MTPLQQQEKFGEVIHWKTYRCDVNGCTVQSSVRLLDGGHNCIAHYLEKVEEEA